MPERAPGTRVPSISDHDPEVKFAEGQQLMISRSMLRLDNHNTMLAVKVMRLRAAITKALEDSESGHGWGPDVTTCNALRQVLKDTE